MTKLPLLLISIFFFIACKTSDKNDSTPDSPESGSDFIIKTNSGKSIQIKMEKSGSSLASITVTPMDFEFSKEPWILKDIDPLTDSFVADLDSNGFEELYLITTSTGSGSYGMIYGYASNSDKSMTPIYLPEPTEDDFKPEGYLNGYMGHDSIFLDQNKLKRKFPVYNEGDANCCPTGGFRALNYKLVPGEAGWILEIAEP